jgi:predicted aspartyl protease
MIEGEVSDDGVPEIRIDVGGRTWVAVIDTGFNGDLELPESVRRLITAKHVGQTRSFLAAGQVIVEDAYEVEFPFDGETMTSQATFVDQDTILVGTHLMRDHRLEVDFVTRKVRLERASGD